MSLELITIRELLRDPEYRTFFTRTPKLPDHYGPANLPWKLIILKPGETAWRTKRFGTYGEAFAGLKKMLPTIENGAINCPPLGFAPPIKHVRIKGKYEMVRGKQRQVVRSLVWKPKLEGDMETHYWCPHCRRPSIFRTAVVTIKPKGNFSSMAGDPATRCIICGVSDRIVNLRHPENAQQWDSTRTKVI